MNSLILQLLLDHSSGFLNLSRKYHPVCAQFLDVLLNALPLLREKILLVLTVNFETLKLSVESLHIGRKG